MGFVTNTNFLQAHGLLFDLQSCLKGGFHSRNVIKGSVMSKREAGGPGQVRGHSMHGTEVGDIFTLYLSGNRHWQFSNGAMME